MYESLLIIAVRVPVKGEYQRFASDIQETAKKKLSSNIESSSVSAS